MCSSVWVNALDDAPSDGGGGGGSGEIGRAKPPASGSVTSSSRGAAGLPPQPLSLTMPRVKIPPPPRRPARGLEDLELQLASQRQGAHRAERRG
jgi:hypothetical protein